MKVFFMILREAERYIIMDEKKEFITTIKTPAF